MERAVALRGRPTAPRIDACVRESESGLKLLDLSLERARSQALGLELRFRLRLQLKQLSLSVGLQLCDSTLLGIARTAVRMLNGSHSLCLRSSDESCRLGSGQFQRIAFGLRLTELLLKVLNGIAVCLFS